MAIQCLKCGADNSRANRFCDTCGSKLPVQGQADEKTEPVKKAKANQAAAAQTALSSSASAPTSAPASVSGAPTGMVISTEVLWLGIILVVGIILRLWDLGAKPLHHDESIHAWYAFKLFQGDSYRYDPAYHGPFLYHANALMYFVFGTSDFASRVLPAIFGSFIIWFMWQWRSLLGTRAAIIAAGLVAISPTWTYVSRFIRDDIYMTLGNLAMVWGMFKWFELKQDKYLYWGMAGWIVAFTSMEATWIFMGLLGTYVFFRFIWEKWFNNVEEANEVLGLVEYLKPLEGATWYGNLIATMLIPFTLAASGFCRFFGDVLEISFFKNKLRLKDNWTVWGKMLLIFFVPFTLLFTTFFTNTDGWARGAVDSIGYWLGEQKTGRADQPWQFYIWLLLLYEIGIVFFALMGGLKIWIGSGKAQYFWMKLAGFLPIFLAIYLLTKNMKDSGMLVVTAGLGTLGCGMLAFGIFSPQKGNNFKTFLVYWTVLAWLMFTLAGERMPWLTLHPLTPLTLLAAQYLGEFFDRKRGDESLWEQWIALGFLAIPIGFFGIPSIRAVFQGLYGGAKAVGVLFDAIFIHKGRHAAAASSGWQNNLWQSEYFLIVGGVLTVFLVALVPVALKRWPKLKYWTRPVFVGLFLIAGFTLVHGTSNLIFYGDGAHPREQHVYVQSSVELVEATEKLRKMSLALTGGMTMKIGIEDLCSWPMSWYLRDFKNAQIGFRPPLTKSQVADFPVVMTGYEQSQPNHDETVEESFREEYSPYPMRFREWWAPDKNVVIGEGVDFWKVGLPKVLKYFVYREPWFAGSGIVNPRFDKFVYDKGQSIASPYGSFDACLWVRKDVEKYFK